MMLGPREGYVGRDVPRHQLNGGSGGSEGHGARSRRVPRLYLSGAPEAVGRVAAVFEGTAVLARPLDAEVGATVLRHWTADKDRFDLPLEEVLAHLHAPDDLD